MDNAQALNYMVAVTVQKMEELSVGDRPGNTQALNDLLGDSWRYTGQ